MGAAVRRSPAALPTLGACARPAARQPGAANLPVLTSPAPPQAKKKPLEALTPGDLGVDAAPRLQTLGVEEPAKRKAGVVLGSAAELVDRLRNEAKVI